MMTETEVCLELFLDWLNRRHGRSFRTGEFAPTGRPAARRRLPEAAPRLRARGAALRALVVLGYSPRLEQEGTTTALRGYDPALYANLDFICLAADGVLKPLIQAPA